MIEEKPLIITHIPAYNEEKIYFLWWKKEYGWYKIYYSLIKL